MLDSSKVWNLNLESNGLHYIKKQNKTFFLWLIDTDNKHIQVSTDDSHHICSTYQDSLND